MAKKETKTESTTPPVAVLRSGIAEKASGSKIFYEIGRTPDTNDLFLRLVGNEGGGTFSKEWVSFERLFGILRDVGKTGKPFPPGPTVQTAYVGRSRNNGPFLAYALRGEGLLAPAGEKGTQATLAGDWTAWAKKALALPVPKVAEEAPASSDKTAKKSSAVKARKSAKNADSTEEGQGSDATDGSQVDDPESAADEV